MVRLGIYSLQATVQQLTSLGLWNYEQRGILLIEIVRWFDKLPSFADSVKQQRTYLFCWSPAGISFCHSMYIVFCSSFPKEGFL